MIQTDLTAAYKSLEAALASASTTKVFAKIVVNEPFTRTPLVMAELFLGFMCFYLVENKASDLRFLAASNTEHYNLSIKDYPSFDPNDFVFPMSDTSNDLVRAVLTKKPVHSLDWSNVSRSAADRETVMLNQASSGIATVYAYPLTGNQQGAILYNYFQYADAIGEDQLEFMRHYTRLASQYLDAEPTSVAA